MLRGLGVRDEDVELCPLARPDARCGRDVHAGVADRCRHLGQRPGRVLDVDDQVDRHAFVRASLPSRGPLGRGCDSSVSEPHGRPASRRVFSAGPASDLRSMRCSPRSAVVRARSWSFAGRRVSGRPTLLRMSAAGCRECGRPGRRRRVRDGAAVRRVHQLCAPLSTGSALPVPQHDALNRVRASSGRAAGPLPGRPGRAQPVVRSPTSARCCAWSTTPSGSTAAPRTARVRRPAPAGRAGRRSCSPCASRATASWLDCPSCVRRAGGRRARCSRAPLPGRLDERVRDRIIAETRGNPLALLELSAA